MVTFPVLVFCKQLLFLSFSFNQNQKRGKKRTLVLPISRQNGTIKLEHQFKIYYCVDGATLENDYLRQTQFIIAALFFTRLNRYVNIWNGSEEKKKTQNNFYTHNTKIVRLHFGFVWRLEFEMFLLDSTSTSSREFSWFKMSLHLHL